MGGDKGDESKICLIHPHYLLLSPPPPSYTRMQTLIMLARSLSAHHLSAADVVGLTGDGRRVVRGKVEDELRDLGRIEETLQRNSRDRLLPKRFGRDSEDRRRLTNALIRHVGLDPTGAEGVHGDSPGRGVCGRRPGGGGDS